MDHMDILKRAWRLLWSYRMLWVFGIILALTTGSPNGGSNSGVQFDGSEGDPDFSEIGPGLPADVQEDLEELEAFFEDIEDMEPQELVGPAIGIAIGLLCLIVALVVVSIIAHYVSQTALIRMVDDHEETGEKLGFRQGFRLGWSRGAWRLFLIDLVVAIPTIVAFILLIGVAAAPVLISAATRGGEPGVIAIVMTIGLAFLVLFVVVIAAVVLNLLLHFFRRASALDDVGVFEAIRQGYAMARQNLEDVGIMWLLMAGVSIAFAIVFVLAAFLLIAIGAVLGGGAGFVGLSVARLIADGVTPWIVAGALGIPIFLLVLVVPLTFLDGLRMTFRSSTWTLTYRELRALESLDSGELPGLDEAESA
jgi:hypothetical protein